MAHNPEGVRNVRSVAAENPCLRQLLGCNVSDLWFVDQLLYVSGRGYLWDIVPALRPGRLYSDCSHDLQRAVSSAFTYACAETRVITIMHASGSCSCAAASRLVMSRYVCRR